MHVGVGWGQEAARNEVKARSSWELHYRCVGGEQQWLGTESRGQDNK